MKETKEKNKKNNWHGNKGVRKGTSNHTLLASHNRNQFFRQQRPNHTLIRFTVSCRVAYENNNIDARSLK